MVHRAIVICLLAGCASSAEVVSCECAVEFNSKDPGGAQGIFNATLVVESCTTDAVDPGAEATAAEHSCTTTEDAADKEYAHSCACSCVHLTETCEQAK